MTGLRKLVRDTGLVLDRTARAGVGNAGLAFVAPVLLSLLLLVLFHAVLGLQPLFRRGLSPQIRQPAVRRRDG